jgi:hypothetical protein
MSTAVVEFETRIGHGRPTRPPRAGSEPSVRPTRAQRPAVSTVRLTRRGRLVVFLGGMTLALAAFIWVGAPAASTGEEHHQVTQTVVVAQGQTLWDIAAEVAPDEDPRVVIADIVDLNALADAGAVRAGQPLYVPAY